MKKEHPVSAIKEGTVIDHIPAHSALKILNVLSLAKEKNRVSLGLNLTGKKLRRKDLIKIEGRFLSVEEAKEIAVFAPDATISIIRNFEVQKKLKAHLPETIAGILHCPNTRCITKDLPKKSFFYVEEYKCSVNLRCKYCEKLYERTLVHD